MPVTTSTTLTNQFQTYFSKELLTLVQQETILDQFAMKNPIPKNQGYAGASQKLAMFRFGPPSISGVQSLGEGTAIASANYRALALNKLEKGLTQYGQVNVPQFQGYSGVTVAPAPIFQGGQAQDAAAMQRYGIQANQAASNMGGLFNLAGSLGSAALLAPSDRRLKSNIVRLGTHPLGIGIYAYDIFGERQLGVMADEVEQVKPEAVLTHLSGYKMVNYGAL